MPLNLGTSAVSLYLGSQAVNAYLGGTLVTPSGTPAALLLNFNGTNGSTTFTDSSANGLTVTANGNAQISTAQSKFGGASGYFDGAGDFLSLPSDSSISGTEDFTVECWLYPLSVDPSSDYTMIFGFENPDGAGAFTFGITSDGANPGTIFAGRAWVAIDHTTTSQISENEWSHVAVTRQAGTLRVFINGVAGVTASDTSNYSQAAGRIGNDFGGNSDYYGYIDDLRVVKGAAVYTANFTPPTAQLGPNA